MSMKASLGFHIHERPQKKAFRPCSPPPARRPACSITWEYDEAVQRFQQILEVLGVRRALAEAGVQAGDTVYIGEYVLEWSD